MNIKLLSIVFTALLISIDGVAAESNVRDDFDVDFNIGWQIDRFTASDLKKAVNPADSSGSAQDALLNIHIDYKLYTKSDVSLWLYGKTDRTIRGTEVLCSTRDLFGCPPQDDTGTSGITNTALDPNVAFVILRDAESLEAHVGLRMEFLSIPNKISPGKLYLSYQHGFASVEGTDDLAEISQSALGIVITQGTFRNSFIEVGKGTNELFPEEKNRNIVRVHLESQLKEGLIGFLETEVDYDSQPGADSVRTKLGFEIPMSLFF